VITITSDPIDLCKMLEEAKDRSAGGTTLFIGSVRDHNEKERIYEIYYEAYENMVEQNLAEVENEARERWNIQRFVAVHRIGNLMVGDISVAVAVSAEHRKEAFEACKYGIDMIKMRAPIWKKEVSDSGGVWVDGIPLKRD
jgi:molybdopterin synthase catalytic subunit